jgi:hypothetical protein
MGARIRAFFAIGAIFALALALVAPGLSAAAAPMAGPALSDSCPHAAAAAKSQTAPGESHGHGKLTHCPDCCLAAHAGSAAVLPQRDASIARPAREAASRVRYFAVTPRSASTAPLEAANGARAPPAA